MSTKKRGIQKMFFKVHPDDEGVDRVTIEVVDRYKESGLSGDEWRVSAVAKFYRKGQLLFEKETATMEWAMMMLAHWWLMVPESSNVPAYRVDGTMCAQPGCDNEPVVTYRLIREWSARGEGPLPDQGFEHRRSFCFRHRTRGDGGLEDADVNYKEDRRDKSCPSCGSWDWLWIAPGGTSCNNCSVCGACNTKGGHSDECPIHSVER